MNDRTAVATRQPSNFEITLEEYAPSFAAVLPPHIPLERFKRVVITAVNQSPDLVAADRRSFFTACQKAAQDGLLPDGREAALVVYRTKVKRNGREEIINAVQYMPMVAGVRKRMRNTGEILSCDGQAVFKNDDFDYSLGDTPYIKHKPTLDEPGPLRAAYCIIKLTNGEIIRDVLTVAKIERARAQSRAKDGPAWTKFYDEMAIKTAIKHASKAAPMSSELDRLMRDMPDDEGSDALPPPRPKLADFSAGRAAEPASEMEPEDDSFTGDIANEVASEMSAYDQQTGEINESAAAEQRRFVIVKTKGNATHETIDEWHDAHIELIRRTLDAALLKQGRDRNAAEMARISDEYPEYREHVNAVGNAFEKRIKDL